MLGIHIEEGNAKGWFGRGAASALLSIATLVLLVGGSAFGIFAAMSDRGETGQSNIPAAPVTPIPSVQMPPAATSSPAPAGVIEITGEQLVRNLEMNPNKYKKGDVLRISGTITEKIDGFPAGHTYLYYYSPRGADNPSAAYSFAVTLNGLWEHSKTTEGAKVTVLGTFIQWSKYPEGGGDVLIDVISVTPAK